MDLSFFSDFANPDKINLLSFGEKMIGSTMVTILGMGITFVGLVFIMYLLGFSSILIRRLEQRLKGKPAEVISQSNHVISDTAPSQVSTLVDAEEAEDIDSETVAAIMAALTVMLQTSTSNIVIQNIKRLSPEWQKAGKTDQFASRF